MEKKNQEEKKYRVLLIRIGENSGEEKGSFCNNISDHFGIDTALLRKIVDRAPIVLKKNLVLRKAEILAKTLKAFGAIVSVEEKYESPPIFLEFQEGTSFRVALESSYLRRAESGTWMVTGRIKNISSEDLADTWVLIQLFDRFDELMTFEEIPLPINPLPPGEASPFKVVFEGGLSVQSVIVAFKNSSGAPLPTTDRRKKRDWVEVELKEEDGKIISPASLFLEEMGETRPFEPKKPPEEPLFDTHSEILETSFTPLVSDDGILPAEERREVTAGEEEKRGEEPFLSERDETPVELLPKETVTEETDSSPDFIFTMPASPEKESSVEFIDKDFMSTLPPGDLLAVTEEGPPGEVVFDEAEAHPDPVEVPSLDLFPLEEASHLLKEIPQEAKEVGEEDSPPFPWVDDCRRVIEQYYQQKRDMFSIWFEALQNGEGFENSIHSLLTILIHARFEQGSDQMDQLGKALENTQRVFRLVPQSLLPLEEIPSLEGTPFLSGETWRDLFHRAIPKIQHIANNTLQKRRWSGLELERLIQVIPHMSHRSSRKAVRWIKTLIPDLVDIDLSEMPLSIGESLFRVASRLGVVDPHFDPYQGRQSMGDLKIQSFAKRLFPQDPMKVEDPMIWVGKKEEEGGIHCFPTHPRCDGCLFETFCPKLFLDFNPSVKGIRSDS